MVPLSQITQTLHTVGVPLKFRPFNLQLWLEISCQIVYWGKNPRYVFWNEAWIFPLQTLLARQVEKHAVAGLGIYELAGRQWLLSVGGSSLYKCTARERMAIYKMSGIFLL